MGYRLIIGRRALCVALLSGSFAIPCIATPYWIAWEGDDWPENQGWTRSYGTFNNPGGGHAVRTLANGELTIDGMQGIGVYDDYVKELGGALDPGLGETFVAQWRVRVDSIDSLDAVDPTVAFIADDSWNVAFTYSYDYVWELATNRTVPIAPGVFHAYELRSWNMRTYEFYIDGELAIVGHFDPGVLYSRAVWGDSFAPSESRSTWNYVRFGVVPESAAFGGALALGIIAVPRRNRTVPVQE